MKKLPFSVVSNSALPWPGLPDSSSTPSWRRSFLRLVYVLPGFWCGTIKVVPGVARSKFVSRNLTAKKL